MDKNELTQKLTALLSKQDRRDQFNAENLHTLAEAALILLEEGGGAGIADVPMEVETIEPNETPEAVMRGDTLVFRIPQGEQGPDGPQGKSAYQVWLEDNGWTAEQHPVSEYINSLKAHVSGFVPVAYDSTAAGKSIGQTFDFALENPVDGSMVLMPNADSSATGSIMFSVSVQDGVATYTRVGDVAIDTSDFLSSSNVDGTELKNPTPSQVAKATDVMGLATKLEGVTLSESKASGYSLSVGVLNADTKAFVGTQGSARYTIIPVVNATRVRFRGVSYGDANTDYNYGFGFYNSNDEIFATQKYEGRNDSGSNIVKEYVVAVPDGAVSLVCSVVLASGTLNESNFYCYFMSGERVVDMIPPVVNSLTEGGDDKALSAEAGKELNNRIVTIENKFGHTETSYTDITALTDRYSETNNKFINSQGKWEGSQGAVFNIFVVEPGDVIKVTRYGSAGIIAILTENETFNQGASASFSSDSEWNARKASSVITGQTDGQSGQFTIPEDGRYLYIVRKSSSSADYVNTEFYLKEVRQVAGIDDKVDAIEDAIAEMPDKIISETQEIPFTLSSETGIVRGDDGSDGSASLWRRTSYIDVTEYRGKSITFLGEIMGVSTHKVGYAFYTADDDPTTVIESAKFDYGGDSNSYIEKWYKVTVPLNASYFRTSVLIAHQSDFKILVSSKLVELITDVAQTDETISNGITHLKPDNVGQLNAVRRMRKMTDLEWTPAFDVSRQSTAGGLSRYNNKFLAGKRYKGLPYARADKAIYGYTNENTRGANFKVGLLIGLETYMTSVYNRGTVMEVESTYSYGLHQAAFYANICAGGVSAALHIDYLTSAQFGADTPPVGFTHIGLIGDSDFDLKTLKLGDVIVNPEVHTAMITDVVYKDGDVVYVEVGENSTQGNNNYTLEGFELGGVARRLWWTANDFVAEWGTYKVRRYNNIRNVPYIPSPYVPMPDEQYGYARYTMAILPYMGNKFRFMLVNGEVPTEIRKLVIEEPGTGVCDANGGTTGTPVVFWSKKVDGEWVAQTPIEIDFSAYNADHPYVYVALPSDMGLGEYRAYFKVKSQYDSVVRNTLSCYWEVVNSLPLLEDF